MSNMNFNCDVCGRDVLGCTFVNGMKFCAKCYQETFGETDKDRKIADLEAKLVESEKKASKKNDESWDLYLSLKQFYSRLGVEAYADDEIQDVAVKELNRLLNENEQLKQQLAENDLKIIELETKLNLKDNGTNV